MQRILAIRIGILGIVLGVSCSRAASSNITLLSETTVQGDTILLSHLLPVSAPGELQKRAEQVSFGSAPEAGQVRTLGYETIVASVQGARFSDTHFDVPPFAVVHRGRAIPKEAVLLAIQDALRSRNTLLAGAIVASDLEMESKIFAPSGDAHLSVNEIATDPLVGRIRFRLRMNAAPKAPSFYVWCAIGKAGDADALKSPWHAPLGATRLHSEKDAQQQVTPRRIASLHLHSRNYSATLQVRPLQSGKNGDAIRVRLPGNGQTLLAQVIGRDLLDARF